MTSKPEPIAIGTSDPNYRKPKAPNLQDWQKITNDPWALEAILGYRIQFASPPIQHPRPRFMTQEEERALQQEVESLMT